MRDLDREQSFVGDDVEKEPRRDPRADAHLPGLEHDVLLSGAGFILLLRGIRAQLFHFAGFGADVEILRDQLRVRGSAFADLLAMVDESCNVITNDGAKLSLSCDSS